MATENILMHCVKKGGDRQLLHERIRVHSVEAAKKIKLEGGENDLIARILSDKSFGLNEKEINGLLAAEQFTGRASEQTGEFLTEVKAALETNKNILGVEIRITV